VRRISTSIEVLLAIALSAVGAYMLYDGSLNRSSANVSGLLIGGACCLAIGIWTLVPAARSILWHRRMLRQARAGDGARS
jgi:hypothetical protein